jgi:endoglucanase
MNEPNGIDASVVAGLMQAGIDGIRSTGATQTIFAEGTSWTGAWSKLCSCCIIKSLLILDA